MMYVFLLIDRLQKQDDGRDCDGDCLNRDQFKTFVTGMGRSRLGVSSSVLRDSLQILI